MDAEPIVPDTLLGQAEVAATLRLKAHSHEIREFVSDAPALMPGVDHRHIAASRPSARGSQ